MIKIILFLLAFNQIILFGSDDDKLFLPTGGNGQIIHYDAFSLQYSEKLEQAIWVAYDLTSQEVQTKVTKRTNDFRIDPKIATGSATLEDYKGSGYDRGHLAPAGDMGWSYRSMSESFLLSNMSPQKPAFNRGIWKKLEEQVRKWAILKNKVYVITGPVFFDIDEGIGESHVDIPDAYFKLVFNYANQKKTLIAFLLKNEKSKKSLKSFVTSVDHTEKLTQLDFFSSLNDDEEIKLESLVQLEDWF